MTWERALSHPIQRSSKECHRQEEKCHFLFLKEDIKAVGKHESCYKYLSNVVKNSKHWTYSNDGNKVVHKTKRFWSIFNFIPNEEYEEQVAKTAHYIDIHSKEKIIYRRVSWMNSIRMKRGKKQLEIFEQLIKSEILLEDHAVVMAGCKRWHSSEDQWKELCRKGFLLLILTIIHWNWSVKNNVSMVTALTEFSCFIYSFLIQFCL